MAAIKAATLAARQTGARAVPGFAIVVVGAAGAFAGSAGAWPVAGIGLNGVFVGNGRRCLGTAHDRSAVTDDGLDPLIHVQARLRIVVTLAALEDADALGFTRLQDMIGLTPGNLLIHLCKVEDADYLSSEKTGNGAASRTTVVLTSGGCAALDAGPSYRAGSTLLAGPVRRRRRMR